MGAKRKIEVGQVFYPKDSVASRYSFRRVVGVVNGRIFYSVGTDKIFSCSRLSFISATSDSFNDDGHWMPRANSLRNESSHA